MIPFGLVDSGTTFNKMMRNLLNGCGDVDHYVDDILEHTVSWNSHLQMMRNGFTRIQQASLIVRPTQCYIGYKTIGFIGHLVGESEVRMEDKKDDKINNAEDPTTKKQMRSFLSLANYYSKFIPNFATVAAPLTDLTKKCPRNAQQALWGTAQNGHLARCMTG